ncbi:glycosyltransferase family 2 protein [Polymorphospora sp. NPDC051019]|uniref:glycosyltransferase family 2 protein n=1 Tax=Polymorphospora sp. NPDC051019 TaxID=3155725 RepID=UPI00343350B3
MTTTTATASVLATARTPDLVRDVELTRPLPHLPADTGGVRRGRAWLVVRRHGVPLGMPVLPLPAGGLPPATLGAALADHLSGALDPSDADRLRAGLPVTADGAAVLAARERARRDGAAVTAVVCTRDRPDALRRCLASLVTQDYPRATVLVVDNAPTGGATRDVVAEFTGVRYVVEPAPGLSRARNRALSEVDTELVAWIDDDEVADRYWLTEVARAFLELPAAAGLSGLVVPGEIETPAQDWYEAFGGHSKGRGFVPDVFVPGEMAQSPLYPLPPFGVGANMAFRREALVAVGGFDPALGAGTPAEGGEDTMVLTRLLLAGRTLVYHPAALVRHYHRREYPQLVAQMRGYGVALTAFYTALVWHRPRLLPRLVALLPRALRDVRDGDSLRNVGVRDGMPPELMSTNLKGMLVGPWRYVRSTARGRRRAK